MRHNFAADAKTIQKQFCCCVAVHEIEWKDILSDISWEEQEFLIKLTVENKLVTKYPLKNSYQQTFLKYIINNLEKESVEIHDDLYNSLCKLQVSTSSETKWVNKHFIVDLDDDGKHLITLQESSLLISEGTTGLRSWQAALALSEWCVSHRELFSGKNVLELGAGAGLLGLVLWSTTTVNSLWLSDCHPIVLDLLVENVSRNVATYSNATRHLFGALDLIQRPKTLKEVEVEDFRILKLFTDNNGRKFGVRNLPWDEINELDASHDIILAADVVFDDSLLPSLCNALKYLMQGDTRRQAIIACTVRNKNTVEKFIQLLRDKQFQVTEEFVVPKVFYWSQQTPIKILRLFLQ